MLVENTLQTYAHSGYDIAESAIKLSVRNVQYRSMDLVNLVITEDGKERHIIVKAMDLRRAIENSTNKSV